MIRQALNIDGNKFKRIFVFSIANIMKRFNLLACFMVLLFVLSPVQAATTSGTTTPATTPDSSLQADSFMPLEVKRSDVRYSLASLEHSSGFIAAPDNLTLEFAPELIAQAQTFDLTPDFNQHKRYWLYTRVANHTDNVNWVLHISLFGFQQSKVLVRTADGQHIQTFQNSPYSDTDINAIGRAIKLKLQPGKSYMLVVELKANHAIWHPYIALMSEQHYNVWEMQMDFAFKIALGIIIALILIAFICWILMSDRAFFWGGLSSTIMLLYYLEHSSLPAILWQYSYEKTHLFWALISASLLSLLAFAASFLQLNKRSGKWYQAFIGTGFLTIVVFAVGIFLSFKGKSILYAFNYLFVWGVILGSGVAKVRSDGRYYIIYILGWLPMVLSILQVILTIHLPQKNTQEITASYKLIHVHYIQILHMMIHAVALILRIKALREDKLKAEFVSQAKSQFIAQSSHDLRQPLNSMNIFLDYLRPHVNSAEGEKIFKQLEKSRQQMSDSFNTILDLSKLEAGAIQADIKAVALKPLFSKIQQEHQVQAMAKGIQLKIHSCSLTVLSDPILLERMLANLVSNAIKYTDSGRVVIGCRRSDQQVAIHVSDTGCGIDIDDQAYVFDIYQRSMLNSKKTEGSGIGLSIVKHLSDLLNHPVNMISIPGQGSSFTITLPRTSSKKDVNNQNEKGNDGNNMPVVGLVFQDNELASTIAKQMTKWGCAVQIYHSVDEMYQFYMTNNVALTNKASANSSLTNCVWGVLLCEHSSLKETPLSSEQVNNLLQRYVLACVCEPETPVPSGWVTLPKSVRPSQLRSLLNFSVRRNQSQLT